MDLSIKNLRTEKAVMYWFVASVAVVAAFFLLQEPSLSSHLAVIIWIFTAGIVIYLVRRKEAGRKITPTERRLAFVLGAFFCVFSFLSIPVGLGNPPYSIDDFSLLLSGATLIFFANVGRMRLLLASSVPLVAVLSFQMYDKARAVLETLAEPLIPPVVNLTVFFLNLLGVKAVAGYNKIIFTSAAGDLIGVPVVFDCTGVESMGTFLLAAAVVFYVFRDMPTKKKLIFLAIGMVGTYLSNIMRVVAICMSGYYYGSGGMMELTHIHAGWVAFTIWMSVFWYTFFVTYFKGQKKK